MKFDSPFFDRIRVKPEKDRRRRKEQPGCEWPSCENAAGHRAPKGRDRENEQWHFCLDHVREYNHSYNFFSGMSDEAVAKYQKDAQTGHRPTWKIGSTGGGGRPARRPRPLDAGELGGDDPFEMFRELGARPRARAGREQAKTEGRTIHNAERKALYAMGLEEHEVSRADIKARFKTLVKRHHPDANGGDRASEDKLREIIQAYNYLKSAGFC
jgi:hypothetical protein